MLNRRKNEKKNWKIFYRLWDSNPRPSPFEGQLLPTELPNRNTLLGNLLNKYKITIYTYSIHLIIIDMFILHDNIVTLQYYNYLHIQ